MAKERPDTHQEAVPPQAAPAPKSRGSRKLPAKPSDVKAQTQEAKDLRTLVTMLSKQNSPESSKDITAYAKETFKLVAKSQKADSAAFKREAAQTLIKFREFVEKTEKLTELRRAKLLSDIDNVNLDVKNATMVLLSVAKTQAKNLKLSAHQEAQERILKAKQTEKEILNDANLKAKALEDESKLRSKQLSKEQEEKFKALAAERKARYSILMEESKSKIAQDKQALKDRKESHKLKVDQDKQDTKDQREKSKLHYANLKAQLRATHDARMQALATEKADSALKNQKARDDLRVDRADAAAKIKKLKQDLRDDYQTKMRAGNADIASKKADALNKNKARINKLRQMNTEHKARLKKIEEEAKAESVMRKFQLNQQLKKLGAKQDAHDKHAGELAGKIKDGALEANPLLHAGVEIFKGVKGLLGKQKSAKALNKLTRQPGGAKSPSVPNPSGAPSSGSSSPSSSGQGGSGGGFFSGLLSMLPSVTGIIGGIGTAFSAIVGAFGKVGGFLLRGAKFIPVIGTVAAVIGGIWDFIEGFNNATALFGDKISDDDYVRKIYSGFTNVVGSILGIFDTVAGWLGFDTNLEDGFKKGAVKLFNAILDTFKSIVGGLAKIVDYIPGMGDVAKKMQTWADSDSPGEFKPNTAGAAGGLTDKTRTVQDLKDQVESSKTKAATIQVVADNSVKQNSTTIVNQKLSTRNNDPIANAYGYGLSISGTP